MIRALFQRREYSEDAAKYIPSNPYPFHTKFKAWVQQGQANKYTLVDILYSVCIRKRIPMNGEWQVLLYDRKNRVRNCVSLGKIL